MNMRQRSFSAGTASNRHLDLQHAAGERHVDSASKTHGLSKNVASRDTSHQNLLPVRSQVLQTSGDSNHWTDQLDPLAEDKKAVNETKRKLEVIADSGRRVEHHEYLQHSEEENEDDDDQLDSIERPFHHLDPDDEFIDRWRNVRHTFKEFLAEILGTTITITIGISGSMVRTISPNAYGNVTTSSFAWGFAVMLGIYVAGGISGGHLNPAISILLSINRGFPWDRCAIYMVAQLIGASLAGAISYGLYRDAIIHYQGNLLPDGTGIVFYTQPKSWVSPPTAFFNEFTATAILACSVLALGDDSNAPSGAGMGALVIGLLVTALTMAFGFTTGGCFNPARDLGPRLVAWAAGYGTSAFTAMGYWWIWGPWCATISGALFGGALYDVFIFVGAESPINYEMKKRRAAMAARKKKKKGWWRRRLDWFRNSPFGGNGKKNTNGFNSKHSDEKIVIALEDLEGGRF